MKRPENFLGILYFLVHFMVEITTFYIISSYVDSNIMWFLAFTYDFFAFVPQGLFGYLTDSGSKINFAVTGMILLSFALLMFHFKLDSLLIILVLAIGNGMVHIQGAETTLRSSKGKMTPSALFVSGGSFGVITGKLLSTYNISIIYIIIINLLMLVPILICNKHKSLERKENLEEYNFSNKKYNYITIIALATFVVIVRAYMGYGIPTTWNKTVVQTILLYCFMGIGKAAGGILIDTIGIRKTALISTIFALPFLLFGDNVMIVSLVGVMMFSMTMAVSLGLIVSELKKYPGIAFGFTTLGLFLGTLPTFLFRIESALVNCLMIVVLSLISILILNTICKKEEV